MSKTWQERFDKRFGIGELSRVSAIIIKQFITDLRKQDEEELVKMTELAPSRPELRQLIKDYYTN